MTTIAQDILNLVVPPGHLISVTPPLSEAEAVKLEQAGYLVERTARETRIHPPFPETAASVIFKYPVRHGHINRLTLPEPCDILHVGLQSGVVTMWARVPPTPVRTRDRYFQVVGTGQPFPKSAEHLGTVQDGGYVWHLIEWTDVTRIERSR